MNDYIQSCQSIVNKIPEGTLFLGVHNPSNGFFTDISETKNERNGIETAAVSVTRQFLGEIIDRVHKINPKLLCLVIPHSRGGVITLNSLKGLSQDQKDKIQIQFDILAMAPAKPLPKDIAFRSNNVYCEIDGATARYGREYVSDQNYDIQFVKSVTRVPDSFWLGEHAFLSKTSQKILDDNFKDKRGKFKFYDGKNR